jgi:hypothetical protein
MKKVIKIENVVRMIDKNDDPFYRTYALLEDGTEAVGFSRNRHEFDIKDSVEVFFDPKHNMIKMQHGRNAPKPSDFEVV